MLVRPDGSVGFVVVRSMMAFKVLSSPPPCTSTVTGLYPSTPSGAVYVPFSVTDSGWITGLLLVCISPIAFAISDGLYAVEDPFLFRIAFAISV